MNELKHILTQSDWNKYKVDISNLDESMIEPIRILLLSGLEYEESKFLAKEAINLTIRTHMNTRESAIAIGKVINSFKSFNDNIDE